MAAPGRVVGFAPITDGDRARAFYEGLLGLEFVKDDGFALVFRSPHSSGGNMVRLAKMPTVSPVQFTVLGWETEQIEADVKTLAARGVEFLRFEFLQHDDLGIWHAPGGDKVCWFKDPDGNVLSLSQHV